MPSTTPLQLIVGLGNPGPRHEHDRHNAGAMFLHCISRRYGGELRAEAKFFGETGLTRIDGRELRMLFPTTYMNHSGKAVAALCRFFKIEPAAMLVAYDEIDFDTGTVRFKYGGGHGGHNGVRDIINALGGDGDFARLRIGVGHPGHKSLVMDHVLSRPPRSEASQISACIESAAAVMPDVAAGDLEAAMRTLHTTNQSLPP